MSRSVETVGRLPTYEKQLYRISIDPRVIQARGYELYTDTDSG